MAVPEVKRARDTGVLMGGVGTIGVIVLTIVLIAASLLALYSLMVFWPPTLSDADLGKVLPDTHSDWFGIPWVLDRDRSLMLMVAIAGATGAMAYVLRSFFKYVGERHLVWSWVPSYLMTPVVGALLAVLTYIVVRAGLISGGPSSVGNPFGFAAIATLVGLFSAQAAEKLKQVFETLFATVPPGSESLESAVQPVIEGFDPVEGSPGDEVVIHGSGLDTAGAVMFGETTSPATWDTEAGVLRTTVPTAAETGPLSVTVGALTATSSAPFVVPEDTDEEAGPADDGIDDDGGGLATGAGGQAEGGTAGVIDAGGADAADLAAAGVIDDAPDDAPAGVIGEDGAPTGIATLDDDVDDEPDDEPDEADAGVADAGAPSPGDPARGAATGGVVSEDGLG